MKVDLVISENEHEHGYSKVGLSAQHSTLDLLLRKDNETVVHSKTTI